MVAISVLYFTFKKIQNHNICPLGGHPGGQTMISFFWRSLEIFIYIFYLDPPFFHISHFTVFSRVVHLDIECSLISRGSFLEVLDGRGGGWIPQFPTFFHQISQFPHFSLGAPNVFIHKNDRKPCSWVALEDKKWLLIKNVRVFDHLFNNKKLCSLLPFWKNQSPISKTILGQFSKKLNPVSHLPNTSSRVSFCVRSCLWK